MFLQDFDINAWSAGIGILLVSAASIIMSIITWRKSNEKQDYANLDGLYQDILVFGSTYYPHFMNPEITKKYPEIPFYDTEGGYGGNGDKGPTTVPSPHERYRYDAYVLMVLSFYESVYDDANEGKLDKVENMPKDDDRKGWENYFERFDSLNWASYFPSFKKDLKIHQVWYNYKDNKNYFKPQFQKVIEAVIIMDGLS